MTTETAFLTDVKTLRARAKKSLDDGAVMPTYQGDPEKTIELLQAVVATELVCVLRYQMHAIAAEGITSESVAAEFTEHAESEHKHMLMAAERIDQLGGIPNLDPEGLASRSATEYGKGGNLVEMIKQNLIAERIVIEHYQELIRYFGDKDPTTRIMLEHILAEEEDHASDMHDLLVAHEGTPFLK
ncbi:ferritin-like domain-containing protein [Sphingomonas abietis]|uniref:Ferritin-like domain-containing protein n=1 Tax=Sphingomonas abietis TaxID=3012344 RepID=A0ABY7NP71_9SPHN|nr:ferritin-like domain-containing protein [Sphingomonas abietis]WBO22745.1 ferritin-like domain-containing protein [Sphingomonas abietis]